MSESKTKSTKSTKSESKSAKPESKTDSASGDATSAKSADSTPAKSDSAPAKSDSAPAKSDSAPSDKSTKGTAAADNSPSYFSSVSTPEYRSGWDSVFSSGKGKKKVAAKPRRVRNGNGLPVTIELDHAELDDDIRAVIEEAFRRKAKMKRVKFDQFMEKAQVTWRLECQFTDYRGTGE